MTSPAFTGGVFNATTAMTSPAFTGGVFNAATSMTSPTFTGATFVASTSVTSPSGTISGSTVNGGTFNGTTFSGSTFSGSTISGSTVNGGTFNGTTFSGTTVSGTTVYGGTIQSYGDIVAYASDDRLKNKLGNIESAVEKVKTLNGFHFRWNDKAKELGMDDKLHVGMSAQEIQKVLPEVIRPAPASNEFLTIQYERVVPLLIEAIKELSAKIDSFEFLCKTNQ